MEGSTMNEPGQQGPDGTAGTPTRPAPPVTDAMREYARQVPNTWIYAVDPAFDGAQDVPGWAVAGAYRVDEGGEIDEEFVPNADYRPSPAVLGFPPPAGPLEVALQNAVTGHGGDDEVRAALLDATVFTPSGPDRTGLTVLDEGLDHGVVHVFTSERYLPGTETWRYWERIPVREIAAVLGEHYLVVNPGSTLELRLPGRDLG
jgi:hypothetical protein